MRFGRLYPLHIAVLALFVLRSISLVLFAAAGMQGVQPQFQHEDVVRILSYLGLLQGFPQLRSIAWNSPSWSISGEYCAYVVFAGLLVLCGRRAVYVLALLALLGSGGYWLLMSVPEVDYFDVYVEFGVLRCLSAFCVGAVAWNLQRNMRWPWRGSHEVTVALLAMAIVGASNEATVLLLGPYLCGGLVLVFHRDAGPLTRMLRWTPFRILGPLSYSIYMIHFLLNQLIWDVWRILAPFTGFGAAQEVPVVDNPWTGDVMALLYLLLLIGISTFTYRWIEVPARDWFRRRAGQRPEGI
jgi:peptidoglycan/LPS O-acetylase OafA/YrhL